MQSLNEKLKVTTNLASEVKHLIWELKHFKEMFDLRTPLQQAKLEFDAGHSIKVPCKWQFYFNIHDIYNVEPSISVSVALKNTEKHVSANFKIELKLPNGQQFFSEVSTAQRYHASDTSVGSQIFSSPDLPGSIFLPKTELGSVLIDNCLTLHIQFEMFSNSLIYTRSPSICLSQDEMGKWFRAVAADDVQQLLDSGEKPDVVIQTYRYRGDHSLKKFKVHKNILMSRSSVFRTMFESGMTEASSGVVHIKDLSYDAMEIILKFIYCGTVQDNWKNHFEEILNGAEKYQLKFLKDFCDKELISLSTPENALNLLNLAKKFNLQNAYKEISDYAKGNLEIVSKLFDNIYFP